MRGARGYALLAVLAAMAGFAVFHACHLRHRSDCPETQDSTAGVVFGQVYDDRGPAAGASVRFKGTREAVQTDVEGCFRLPRPVSGSTRITAWKNGYRIAGVSADLSPVALRLMPVPHEDNDHYTWVAPDPEPAHEQNCGNCHVQIYEEWAASGHARSASGRHFLNLYEGTDWHGRQNDGWSLLAEHPDGAGVCTSCHAPTVAFEDPAYYDLRKARGASSRGVHCDYCHKVAGAINEQIGFTHGRFGVQLLRPREGQLFIGPLDDVDRGEDTFAPLYHDSRYCASCHEGTVFGVPVYSTYSEWLASPARQEGKHCQTCHMTPTGSFNNIAPGKGGISRDPLTLANHRFFAGSRSDMLKRSLKVHIQFTSSVQGLRAELDVQAEQVGHRVPTGFPDRQLVLAAEAYDEAGLPIPPRTGPLLPATAGKNLAGRLGRLYAKQLSDFDGHKPVPFWRAQPDLDDSRLVPGRPDRIAAQFPARVSRLRVRLLYRRFWEEVALAKGWPDNDTIILDKTFLVSPGNQVQWTGP